MSFLEGFDFFLMSLRDGSKFLILALLPKGLILFVAHHDGLVELPILHIFFLEVHDL
jgi:hypothetical protein